MSQKPTHLSTHSNTDDAVAELRNVIRANTTHSITIEVQSLTEAINDDVMQQLAELPPVMSSGASRYTKTGPSTNKWDPDTWRVQVHYTLH